MAWRPILTVTYGVAGVGKTFARVSWIANHFLPHEAGTLWTNLPLKVDALVEYCVKTFGSDGKALRKRIKIIPKEKVAEWAAHESGPWDYWRDTPIAGHIILDEAHRIVSSTDEKDWYKEWQAWIGELRHVQGSLELITQAENKLPRDLLAEAERIMVIQSDEKRRDWAFGIENHFWYQLVAKLPPVWPFTIVGVGKYSPMVIAQEFHNAGGRGGTARKLELETAYQRRAQVFELYDSYSAPDHGGVALGRPKMEYELKTWPAFLLWFFLQNANRIGLRLAYAGVFVWAVFFGGWSWCMETMIGKAGEIGAAQAQNMAKPPRVNKPPTAPLKGQPEPTPAPGHDEYVDAVATQTSIKEAAAGVQRSKAIADQQKDQVIASLNDALAEYKRLYDRASEVVAVTGETFTLRDGTTYRFGETIKDGKLTGRRVLTYDRRTRLLALDNGELLKLGGNPQSVSVGGSFDVGAVTASGGKVVPSTLPRDPRPASEATGNIVRKKGNAGRPGGAVPLPAGVDGRPVQDQRSGGPVAPRQGGGTPSVPGNPKPDPVRSQPFPRGGGNP